LGKTVKVKGGEVFIGDDDGAGSGILEQGNSENELSKY
jgi:hypothetical protein